MIDIRGVKRRVWNLALLVAETGTPPDFFLAVYEKAECPDGHARRASSGTDGNETEARKGGGGFNVGCVAGKRKGKSKGDVLCALPCIAVDAKGGTAIFLRRTKPLEG